MTEEVPVLVVGGSLVGMTTAMLLGKHEVAATVVERHPGTAIHPRAAFLLQRSVEILRESGIEDQVREESLQQFDPDGAVMSVRSLAGEEIAYHIANLNEGVRDMSPSERTFVSQIALEPRLQARAEELGADVHFSTELIDFSEDGTGVTATVADRVTGETREIRAQYMVAADGPRSTVRDRLGIGVEGHGVFSKAVTIYFKADVSGLLRGRNLSVVLVNNPELRGFFRFEKPYRSAFLVVHTVGDPDDPVTDIWPDRSDAEWIELVNAALGTDEVQVEIDDVMRWEAVADVADSYGTERVLLAGDAAHAVPPYGGYGGNMGIHDAHNFAWKLAMVLAGTAGPGLLATYEPERRPIARFTAEQAYTRYVQRAAPYLATDDLHPIVDDLTIDLGHRYHSAAVVEAPDADTTVHDNPRELHAVAGSRAPHVWLERDGTKLSTLDLFGDSFVLIGGPNADALSQRWLAAFATAGLALDIHLVGATGLRDPDGAFLATYALCRSGAVVVRPDGFVAWRSADDPDGPQTDLTGVLGTLLERSDLCH